LLAERKSWMAGTSPAMTECYLNASRPRTNLKSG
jgi:hypothetical protein